MFLHPRWTANGVSRSSFLTDSATGPPIRGQGGDPGLE